MTVTVRGGTCGLIGPNGAGKTTFFNVLSGFVEPASGASPRSATTCSKMAHFRRARWGMRRTFQTEQAIEELSVYDNVALVHEHSKARVELAPSGRARTRSRSSGSSRSAGTKVGTLGARDRRLVEVARALVGKPRVVLLDEPAAGLPEEETGAPGGGDPADPRAQ